MFTPVKNKKMYVQVAEQIKTQIMEGKLKVGNRLPPERELCHIFDVSRSTIREALTSLEIMGYIEVRTGLGTFIKNLKVVDEENALATELEANTSPTEIFEARMLIEPRLSYLAAQRASKEDLEGMERLLLESQDIDLSQVEKFEDLDRKYHLTIAKAANNEALYRFAESINSERMGRLWGNLKLKSLQKEGRMERYKSEHRDIFNAIHDRNSAQAEKLTLKHLMDIKKNIFG